MKRDLNPKPILVQRQDSWRWSVCGLLLLASAINYMDRQTLAGAAVRITHDFKLSQSQYGRIEEVFGYAFAAGSLLFGWMSDRFSLRRVYAGVLASWSLTGMATGWATDYHQLLWCRAALGFFEAGHWPCAIRTTRILLDERNRSLGNGLLQGGATLGAVVTPLLLPLLMAPGVSGWRPPFICLGAIGLLWLIPWLGITREQDLQRSEPQGLEPARNGPPFSKLIRSRRMLAVLLTIGLINTTWQVLRAWLPKFLQEDRGYSEWQALQFISFWFIAADIGCLLAGATATRMARRGRSPAFCRFEVFAVCALLCTTTVLIPQLAHGPWLMGVLLLVAAGSLGVFPLYHTFTQDLSGPHQGKITGIAGIAAWIIPAQAQRWFGVLADRTHSMDLGLALAGLLPLMALIPLWYLRQSSSSHRSQETTDA